MPKNYTRKDFIKISTIAGTGIILNSCGVAENNEGKITSEAELDSVTKRAMEYINNYGA